MINQKQTFKVLTDENGVFKINVENTFNEGLHSIIVKAGDGEKDSGLFYIVQGSEIINKIQTTVSPLFLSSVILLMMLVLVLSIDIIRLGKRIDSCEIQDEIERLKKKKHYEKHAMRISSVAIIITIILAIVVNNETQYFKNKTDQLLNKDLQTTQEVTLVDVKGYVRKPFSDEKIAGIDLSVGNVSIKTIDNGLYSFNEVDLNLGIQINDSNLRKTIQLKISVPGEMDIIYDANLFNTLVSLMDYEAYGKIDNIYAIADASIVSKYTKFEFADKYVVNFDIENVNDQKLKIGNILEYDNWTNENSNVNYSNVVSIEVYYKNKTDLYYFTKTSDGVWKYIYKNI